MDREERPYLFDRIDNGISKLEGLITGTAIALMAINTIANVFGRYVFSQSLYFTEEVNEILMVTVTFVGLGYVTRKGRHIRMSAVYDLLPQSVRRWLMVIIALTTAAAMFLLAWHAFGYVEKLALRGRITPAMQLPLWTTYVGVVLGLFLTGVQYLLTAWANATRSEGVWISYRETDEYEDPELAMLLELQHATPDAPPLQKDRTP